MKRLAIALGLLLCAARIGTEAQLRVTPIDLEHGHVALGLALRHLGNIGIFMMATAHPDDENNGLLVMLNRGRGYRTTLATATRGNGGQNEIGRELYEALGVLRTEELHAIHRFDGAEQYFTRAVDFGFSFSLDETFAKWGREDILADYVRLIRTIRPDVIAALPALGAGGSQHHQASAILARDAYNAAGDRRRFPDQIAAGLLPWQPQKFYLASQVGYDRGPAVAPQGQLTVDIGGYDPLLGQTWAEIGAEARSMHKCQGTDQLLWLPGPASATYQLAESVLGPITQQETSLFDGIDSSITGLARLAMPRAPNELVASLTTIADAVQLAQTRFGTGPDPATVAPLLTGLRAVNALRAALPEMALAPASRFELDFRLAQKEREFEDAVVLASRVRIEAIADDLVVVAGQRLGVSLVLANRGEADVEVTDIAFKGLEGTASCALRPITVPPRRGAAPAVVAAGQPLSVLRPADAAQCSPILTVPDSTRITEPYWHRAGEAGRYTFDSDAPFGLPYRPTPFRALVALSIAGAHPVVVALPIQARYQSDVFSGEKRADILVVPEVSVTVSPSVALFPTSRGRTGARLLQDAARDIRVTVVNDAKRGREYTVRLDTPAGWTTTPPQQTATLAREDESRTLRFRLTAPADAAAGEVAVKAVVTGDGASLSRGFQAIEYPHIRRQHVYREAEMRAKVLDVRTAPNLTVGYIMGVGDEVPAAIEQLGVKVDMIEADDLAWGDLTRFSTIVTGVRAYERRADLRANNSRLLDYVRNGGTVIVQYNKFEFNEAQYGPYPAKVSSTRAAEENASIRPLVAADAVFNNPNRLSDAAWLDWVQERGLYFLGDKDPRYRDLLSVEERSPNNAGEKLGALVAARYGRGRWLYVGLNLWRQLPAGVDGAYQLLANLISVGH